MVEMVAAMTVHFLMMLTADGALAIRGGTRAIEVINNV